MSKLSFRILICSFCIHLINCFTWEYIKDLTEFSPYYIVQALTFIGYMYVIYSMTKGIQKIVSKAFLFVMIGNLIDEAFFDPEIHFQLNELIAFGIVIVFLIEDLINHRHELDG